MAQNDFTLNANLKKFGDSIYSILVRFQEQFSGKDLNSLEFFEAINDYINFFNKTVADASNTLNVVKKILADELLAHESKMAETDTDKENVEEDNEYIPYKIIDEDNIVNLLRLKHRIEQQQKEKYDTNKLDYCNQLLHEIFTSGMFNGSDLKSMGTIVESMRSGASNIKSDIVEYRAREFLNLCFKIFADSCGDIFQYIGDKKWHIVDKEEDVDITIDLVNDYPDKFYINFVGDEPFDKLAHADLHVFYSVEDAKGYPYV